MSYATKETAEHQVFLKVIQAERARAVKHVSENKEVFSKFESVLIRSDQPLKLPQVEYNSSHDKVVQWQWQN